MRGARSTGCAGVVQQLECNSRLYKTKYRGDPKRTFIEYIPVFTKENAAKIFPVYLVFVLTYRTSSQCEIPLMEVTIQIRTS